MLESHGDITSSDHSMKLATEADATSDLLRKEVGTMTSFRVSPGRGRGRLMGASRPGVGEEGGQNGA